MEKNEYEEFIKCLFYEYMEKKLARIRRKWHPFHFIEEWRHFIPRLTRAMRVIRFIEDYFDEDEEIRDSLRPEMLNRTLDSVEDGVKHNNRLTVDSEIVEVIQDYFAEIVDGMSVEHFPEEDFEVMRQSGSLDARREITAIVHLLKSRKEKLIRNGKEVRFSKSMKRCVEIISERRELLKEEEGKSNKKVSIKRRWFKGIGTICQGTLLSITDISVACGFWPIPLPVETKTVGAVVSATSGIGMIITGIGELRGE